MNALPCVLVVDDHPPFRTAIRRQIAHDFEVLDASSGEEALELLKDHRIDVALIDLLMPGMSGMAVLERFRERSPGTECIIVTGDHDIETANQCLNAGASDYFEKPILDWGRFNQILRRAVQVAQLRKKAQVFGGDDTLLGSSPEMEHVRSRIRSCAPSSSSILIQGESGSGKELAARALHDLSGRTGPFIAINCGAIAENLIEVELFGAEPGTYTGQNGRKIGKFEAARGGTLFLDEIGELQLQYQPKLLRALEQGAITRVGGNQEIPVNVRVVSATNRDLKAEVDAGRFREDLYFRLDVVHVQLPPLRERSGDVKMLTYRFIQELNGLEGKSIRRVSPEAMALLERAPWPGNVRELRNALRRAIVLAQPDDEVLTVEHLDQLEGLAPPPARSGLPGLSPELLDLPYAEAKERIVAEFTVGYLKHQLHVSDQVIKRAAERAGMLRPNFSRLMKKFQVEIGAPSTEGE